MEKKLKSRSLKAEWEDQEEGTMESKLKSLSSAVIFVFNGDGQREDDYKIDLSHLFCFLACVLSCLLVLDLNL